MQVGYNLYKDRPATENLGRSLLVGAAVGGTLGAAAPEATAAFTAQFTTEATVATGAATGGAGAIAKIAVPETPGGISNAEFGQKVMQWGGNSAQAIARIGSLSADKLREAGLTSDLAQKWADFYVHHAAANPANPSAAGRAELMQAAADLLK